MLERVGEVSDIAIDLSSKSDIRTVTGHDNYVQRYRDIVFRTELGENRCFPGVGVYRGIGRKSRIQTRHLTRLSAQEQLLSDPRTVGVNVLKDEGTGDTVIVEFEVTTQDASSAIEV